MPPFNEIEHEAVGSGYYRVYADGNPIAFSQHTTERKAQQQADKLVNEGHSDVHWIHEYRVDAVGIGENVGLNVGENTGSSGSGSPAQSVVIVPGDISLFDTFAYDVSRLDSRKLSPATNPFITTGVWGGFADAVINPGYGGYMYTSNDAGQSGGVIPGQAGTHFLVMESAPTELDPIYQTDMFVEPPATGALDYIPADVWFQFWIYLPSDYFSNNRMKFIYPNKQVNYPAPPVGGLEWLISLGGDYESYNPYCHINTDRGMTLINSDAASLMTIDPAFNCSGATHLGQTNTDGVDWYTEWIRPLTWTLVKIRMDTSGAQGSMEAWMRQYGTPTWTKTNDWRGGVSPDPSFNFVPLDNNGHATFRMPVSIPGGNSPSEAQDSRTFITDFAMARGVNSGGSGELPTYPY